MARAHFVAEGAVASSARCAHSAEVMAGALGSGLEKMASLMRSTYALSALFSDSCKTHAQNSQYLFCHGLLKSIAHSEHSAQALERSVTYMTGLEHQL